MQYLFDKDITCPLEYSVGRNPDIRDLKLVIDGDVKLHFAVAYGFRNIQTILRKIKRKKCTYDYVEVRTMRSMTKIPNHFSSPSEI